MNNKAKEELFDAILSTAFMEYWERELEKMPSDEELKKMYPVPKKGLRMAKRLEKRRKYGKPLALVYLQRAAVIVLVVIAASAAILATSPDIRAAVGNSFTSWFKDHMVIDFTEDPVPPVPEKAADTSENSEKEAAPATVETLKIGYIPEGFELVSEEVIEGRRNYMYILDTEYIMIAITDMDISKVSVDNELNDYTELTIDDQKAYLLYNEQEKMGTLIVGTDRYTVTVTGVVSQDTLINVANSIK